MGITSVTNLAGGNITPGCTLSIQGSGFGVSQGTAFWVSDAAGNPIPLLSISLWTDSLVLAVLPTTAKAHAPAVTVSFVYLEPVGATKGLRSTFLTITPNLTPPGSIQVGDYLQTTVSPGGFITIPPFIKEYIGIYNGVSGLNTIVLWFNANGTTSTTFPTTAGFVFTRVPNVLERAIKGRHLHPAAV